MGKSLLSTALPQVVISSGNSTVEAGSTVLLACVSFGAPSPSITWSTDSSTVHELSNVNVIINEAI